MEKKLYRSFKNKMLGGVASGLANYFDIDPVLVRVIFIVTALGWGVSIVAYIILWIIVPLEPVTFSNMQADEIKSNEEVFNSVYTSMEKKKSTRRITAGVILIVLGVLFFLHNVIPDFRLGHFWPIVLILLGLLIMIKTPFFNRGLKEVK